jgi:hypothetical protein
MADFTAFTLYDMYASSRATYLTVVNDPYATDAIVPQIKAQQTTWIRAFPPKLRRTGVSFWNLQGRDFVDSMMDWIATNIKNYEERPSLYPYDVAQVINDNLLEMEISLSNAQFINLSAPAQSALSTFDAAQSQIRTDIPSAIFNKENAELYKNQKVPVYSGVDINVVFLTPHVLVDSTTFKTISYSSHVEANEVRVLGRSYPKGYTDSPRTIAGSMIGTLSINDPMMELHPEWFDGEINKEIPFQDLFKPYLLTDQLPLFDILVLFQNEYGFMSAFTIFGCKIPDHGIVMSIDDSVIEVTYQFKAMDVDVVHEVNVEGGKQTYIDDDGNIRQRQVKKVVDILHNDEYILRHNQVIKGESLHRSILDVPYLWDQMWENIHEIEHVRKSIPGSRFGLLTKKQSDISEALDILDQ